MTAIPTIAAIRFGTGLSPLAPPPKDGAALLAGLAAPDEAMRDYPVPSTEQAWHDQGDLFDAKRDLRKEVPGAKEAVAQAEAQLKLHDAQSLCQAVQRAVYAKDSFRERLQTFWANHFTTVNISVVGPSLTSAFVDEAIRPHLAGRFPDMLKAVETHPAMLDYLTQTESYGPNSPEGHHGRRGVNENLGRELMELHTMGVGAGYTQTDVRQMSYLLTGLTHPPRQPFAFDAKRAEPMTETILGKQYGGPVEDKLDQIYRVLDDIAARPETAAHLSRQIATHFVSDTPEQSLVDAMTTAYLQSDGNLTAVYRAMLEHEAAWAPFGAKVRQPFDFLVAGIRALAPTPDALERLKPPAVKKQLYDPLQSMGQPFQRAPGPNGWPEEAAAWIQPQLLAARMQWALQAPRQLVHDLPDPRDFVQTALADAASPATRQAAERAESREEGIGLVLLSNDFNRR